MHAVVRVSVSSYEIETFFVLPLKEEEKFGNLRGDIMPAY